MSATRRAAGAAGRGFTLAELMVVVTLIGVLAAVAVPSFRRAVEQARADVAVANLQAIWSAQRYYWVVNRTYANDTSVLSGAGLIDPTLTSSAGGTVAWYSYQTASDGSATATPQSGASPGDYLKLDAAGNLTGTIHSSDGTVITPTLRQ
jgi:type IV pilus assembly protein PilE